MDLTYWEKYYSQNSKPFNPSSFAKNIVKNINKKSELIDIGCGNGRDSLFFSSQKIYTVGVDQSVNIVNILKQYENKYLKFQNEDIENLHQKRYDYAYCRFLFHSLNENEESSLLQWLKDNITKNIFIESRIDEDKEKYSKTDHYRRLMNIEDFKSKLTKFDLKIQSEEKSNKFSIYKENYNVSDISFNPMLVRFTLSP
jgi:tellurite methyltransferase